MGPRFFPKVISIIMASASIGLIINNLLKYLREKKGNKVVNETGEKSEKGMGLKHWRMVNVAPETFQLKIDLSLMVLRLAI